MKKTWTEEPLHGRYEQRTDNDDVDKATTSLWLSSSSLKEETEGLILAAQYQSIPTRVYQSGILKIWTDRKCRSRTNNENTVDNITSGFTTIINTEYLQTRASQVHTLNTMKIL